MTHIDENAFTLACDHVNVDQEILRSLILRINERYFEVKKRLSDRSEAFYTLWTTTLRDDQRIDLLSFQEYKAALAKYYGSRKNAKKTKYPMIIEKKTPFEARVRVSDGVSIVFRSLNTEGKLKPKNLTYLHHVIHTYKDVSDDLVMQQAQTLACRAMNSLRKSTKRRKAA